MVPELKKKSGPKILVVDDDPNEMRSLVIGLKLEGFDAAGVSNGAQALTALGSAKYSAVVIDLMMPEMNGLQLAREIRASHPSVTTMLMSAYHLSPLQLARADTGVVGFVPKPFCFEELVSFIRSKTSPGAAGSPERDRGALKNGLHAPIDVTHINAELE